MVTSQLPDVGPDAPLYWQEACRHLMKRDRVMKKLIPQFGDACLQSRGDPFVTLARSVVGQQISVQAAQTIWDRFAKIGKGRLMPAKVLKMKVDDMRVALRRQEAASLTVRLEPVRAA